MRKLLITFAAFALLSAAALAQSSVTCPADTVPMSEVLGLSNFSVKEYTAFDGVERVEFITPYMDKQSAVKQFKNVVHRLEANPRYTRLNGGRYQILFMEDQNINRTILVAMLKSVFGMRVIVAYDKFELDETN